MIKHGGEIAEETNRMLAFNEKPASDLALMPTSLTRNSAMSENKKELLTAWVEEHGDFLFSYALRYFRDELVAEEIVQDTFLAAVQGLESFEHRSSPRTWLTSILRHKVIDKLRNKTKESIFLQSEALEKHTDDFFDASTGHWTVDAQPLLWSAEPESILAQKEFLLVLERCLAKLPEQSRQLFMLREVEGYGREELSEQFKLTSNNVGVILHRTRLALQNCLQQNWFLAQEEVCP